MSTSSSRRVPKDELVRRRNLMVQEADSPAGAAASTARKPTSASSSSSSSSPTKRPTKRRNIARATTPPPPPPSSSRNPASPSLAIKFAGKVYRTLENPSNGMSYSPNGDLFGEPDEEVGEADREKMERLRKEAERDRMRLMSTSSSEGKKRRMEVLLDSDEEGEDSKSSLARKLTTPTKVVVARPRTPSPPRQRTTMVPSPSSLGQPFSLQPSSFSSSSSPTTALPAPLATLLKLHERIEGALILHLSISGSSVASSATEFNRHGHALVRIPNLIDLPELIKMVRTGATQFGEVELSQLVWAWEGCGEEDEDDDGEEEDIKVEKRGEDECGGLGFIVSRKRLGNGGSIQTTYGVGISVQLKSNPQLPKFELLPPTSPSRKLAAATTMSSPTSSSPSSGGKGRDGMNVVALWTQGKDARRTELLRRLRGWGKRCAREEQARQSPIYSPNTPLFPTTLPSVPRATLPPLSPAIHTIVGTSSPSPKKPKIASDVFGPAVPIAGPSGTKSVVMLLEEGQKPIAKTSTKAKDRNKLMRERLLAKQAEAAKPISTNHAFLSTLSASNNKSLKSASNDPHYTVEKEMYKRNAMVSRLGNIADVVVMLSNKCGSRPVLLYEVSTAVSNSPLVKIGEDEAHDSLKLLCELFPDFASIKSVDRQEWLTLRRDARAVDVKMKVMKELEEIRRGSGAYA